MVDKSNHRRRLVDLFLRQHCFSHRKSTRISIDQMQQNNAVLHNLKVGKRLQTQVIYWQEEPPKICNSSKRLTKINLLVNLVYLRWPSLPFHGSCYYRGVRTLLTSSTRMSTMHHPQPHCKSVNSRLKGKFQLTIWSGMRAATQAFSRIESLNGIHLRRKNKLRQRHW